MVWKIAGLGLIYGLLLASWLHSGLVLANQQPVSITFLNVGEGEATLIQAGDRSVLIDAGNVVSVSQLLTFLSNHQIDKIDHLLITNPHLDHMSGVFRLLHEVPVNHRYDNGEMIQAEQGDIYRWYDAFFRKNNYRALSSEDQITLPGATLSVLNTAKEGRSWNANSIVLALTCYGHRVLLMGDATVETEQRLLSQGESLSASLIKVGHHGWTDATSVNFLNAVSPQYAVISINQNNMRGYPSDEIIERLRSKQAEVLTTFKHGDIQFVCDQEGIHRVM